MILRFIEQNNKRRGEMPIYKANEMIETPDVKRPHISMIQYGGELIKAGLVTYYEGDAPPPTLSSK